MGTWLCTNGAHNKKSSCMGGKHSTPAGIKRKFCGVQHKTTAIDMNTLRLQANTRPGLLMGSKPSRARRGLTKCETAYPQDATMRNPLPFLSVCGQPSEHQSGPICPGSPPSVKFCPCGKYSSPTARSAAARVTLTASAPRAGDTRGMIVKTT